MAVYVDGATHVYGGMRMCHMIADTREELLVMVDKIGVLQLHRARSILADDGKWYPFCDCIKQGPVR